MWEGTLCPDRLPGRARLSRAEPISYAASSARLSLALPKTISGNDLCRSFFILAASRETYLPVHERTAWRSSSAVWLRPLSMSRSAWSSGSSRSVRSFSLSIAKPNRWVSNRDSSPSRSFAVNRSIACSIASIVLIAAILPSLLCGWQLPARREFNDEPIKAARNNRRSGNCRRRSWRFA